MNGSARAEWEAVLADYCQQAKLTVAQRTVILLRIIDRYSDSAICHTLRGVTFHEEGDRPISLKTPADVTRKRVQALGKLTPLPGFWEAARRFEKDLPPVAANRKDDDTRPPDVRGVTPDPAFFTYQHPRLVDSDYVRQSADAAARLWGLENRPSATG